MMWSVRVRLIRSISEHRVVDFPEPVGPVTSTRPFVKVAELLHLLRDPELLDAHDLGRDQPNTAIGPLRSRAAFTRKRAKPGDLVREGLSRPSPSIPRGCAPA